MSNQYSLQLLARLAKGLAGAIGRDCEVVLHDFSDPEHSIIAIENGHVTGREIGDGLDDLGFRVLRRGNWDDMINYRTRTKDGRDLRSSSVFLRDENGKVYGALCVNLDISRFISVANYLTDFVGSEQTGVPEHFQKNVDQVLEQLISEATRNEFKPLSEMAREDKVRIVAQLESRGAFLIRHAVERVASLLSVSKFTVYSYLEDIKSDRPSGKTTRAGLSKDGHKIQDHRNAGSRNPGNRVRAKDR